MRLLLRLLLALHPRDFREARRSEVMSFVEEGERAARERGGWALFLLRWATVMDLVASAVRMWWGRIRGVGRNGNGKGREGMMRSLAQDLG